MARQQGSKRFHEVKRVPGKPSVPEMANSAVILCDSAALGEAVSRALPIPTHAIRIDQHDEADVPSGHPKLILVIELRGEAALDAVRAAKSYWPGSPTLVVGIANEEDMILACIAAGADGVVESSEGFSELRGAIDSVIGGDLRVPGSATRRFFNRLVQKSPGQREWAGRSRLVRLSVREKEILKWIRAGLTNKDIANRLGISEQTVKNHVGNVLRKLGVHSRFDAARLVTPPAS